MKLTYFCIKYIDISLKLYIKLMAFNANNLLCGKTPTEVDDEAAKSFALVLRHCHYARHVVLLLTVLLLQIFVYLFNIH